MSDVEVWIGVIGALVIFVYMARHAPDPNAGAEKIVCQFCHQAGGVRVRLVQRKQGISGGKATGAVVTGGISLFATGLSRKQQMRHLTCSSCHMEWDVA